MCWQDKWQSRFTKVVGDGGPTHPIVPAGIGLFSLYPASLAWQIWHEGHLMVSSSALADSCRRKTLISRSTWRKRPRKRRG